jgi:HEAT repeat protein
MADGLLPEEDQDPRSVDGLFATTLEGEYDDEEPWEAVHLLRRQNTQEVFDAAIVRCESADPKTRARAIDVLAQLGAGEPDERRPFLAGCVDRAIAALGDSDPLVVHSAAWALAHLKTDAAVTALLPLKGHDDPDIRHAVALGMVVNRPDVVQVLLELMRDADDNVRDWATFGLALMPECDSAEIRAALRERLHDPFPAARAEAVLALASRRDRAGLELLLRKLESGDAWNCDETTACELLDLPLSPEPPVDQLCAGIRALLAGTEP